MRRHLTALIALCLLTASSAFAQESSSGAEEVQEPATKWSLGLGGGVYAGVSLGYLDEEPYTYTYFSAALNRSLGSEQRWNIGFSPMVEVNNLGGDHDTLGLFYGSYSPLDWLTFMGFAGGIHIPETANAIAGGFVTNVTTPWGPNIGVWLAGNSYLRRPNLAVQVSYNLANLASW